MKFFTYRYLWLSFFLVITTLPCYAQEKYPEYIVKVIKERQSFYKKNRPDELAASDSLFVTGAIYSTDSVYKRNVLATQKITKFESIKARHYINTKAKVAEAVYPNSNHLNKARVFWSPIYSNVFNAYTIPLKDNEWLVEVNLGIKYQLEEMALMLYDLYDIKPIYIGSVVHFRINEMAIDSVQSIVNKHKNTQEYFILHILKFYFHSDIAQPYLSVDPRLSLLSRSGEEFIFAHEMAHVLLRHSPKMSAFTYKKNNDKDLPLIVSKLLVSDPSIRQEISADSLALEIQKGQDLNAYGLASTLSWLHILERISTYNGTVLPNTHPPVAHRKMQIYNMLKKDSASVNAAESFKVAVAAFDQLWLKFESLIELEKKSNKYENRVKLGAIVTEYQQINELSNKQVAQKLSVSKHILRSIKRAKQKMNLVLLMKIVIGTKNSIEQLSKRVTAEHL